MFAFVLTFLHQVGSSVANAVDDGQWSQGLISAVSFCYLNIRNWKNGILCKNATWTMSAEWLYGLFIYLLAWRGGVELTKSFNLKQVEQTG